MKSLTRSFYIGGGLYLFAEVLLFASYRSHDARFHWFTHFFVGAIVALIVMAIVTSKTKRPVRLPLLWLLLGHLFAMFPDFLFSLGGIAHEKWMDLFLYHIGSHFIPGRNFTWYALFLLALGIYFWALYRYTSRPPKSNLSEKQILGSIDVGKGEPIVFLHGILGSARYWESVIKELKADNWIISFDLLGFGNSPKPADSSYDRATQIKAIADSLHALKVDKPITLVGHSMGALIALGMAVEQPKTVKRLVLIGMPVYEDIEQARAEIVGAGIVPKFMVYGPIAKMICMSMHRFQPLIYRFAPKYRQDLPMSVIKDSMKHTWNSYSRSMEHIIENQNVVKDLSALKIKTELIYGSKDGLTETNDLSSLEALNSKVKVEIIPGTHHLPIEEPELIARHISND